MNAVCSLCGNKDIEVIHCGTRDNSNINVLKCKKCGLVFLSSFEQISDEFYENSHMHDNEEEESFEDWVAITKEDDDRRVALLEKTCKEKKILDFGCGNAGFLRGIMSVAHSVSGVEIEDEARKIINAEGIKVYKSLDDCKEKYDIITCFHVIEHLENPLIYLKTMSEHLYEGGKIIIETPNSEDALLSLYHVKEFADFTYWSPHIILYNYNTIALLAEKAGLQVKWNRQLQRYPLSNHLYWLSEKQPGGHVKWDMFNDEVLIKEYQHILEEHHWCDTLFVCLEMRSE
ncbi:MAG: class I SAM-dependent methyltransferase [Lachnospiraceae bacterium]